MSRIACLPTFHQASFPDLMNGVHRPMLSCLQCRNRKVRCSGDATGDVSECRNCVRRGEECVWPSSKAKRRYGKVRSGHESDDEARFHGMEERLQEMEKAIADLRRERADVPPSRQRRSGTASLPYAHRSPDTLSFSTTTPNGPNAPNLLRSQTSEQDDRPKEIQAMDEFDHQIISSRRAQNNKRASPDRSTMEDEHGRVLPPSAGSHDDAQGIQAIFTRFWTKVPAVGHCDKLLESYWEKVEWIHHVVHRPSFERWLERTRRSVHVPSFARREDLHMAALLFSMLCLSIHFSEKATTEDRWFAKQFHTLSCKALEAGDYLDHHSVASIQTLIMQGLWLNDHGKSERHHANLAIAIRMANGLGMSRQDAYLLRRSEAPLDPYTQIAVSIDKSAHFDVSSEMARRIYWSLICQDCYTASSCNFTYMIQPQQIEIAMPCNLDDDQLQERAGDTDERRPMNEMTEMSYHIVKVPFAILTRQSIDFIGLSSLRQQFDNSVQLEEAILRAYERVPEQLQFREEVEFARVANLKLNRLEQTLAWQRLFLKIGIYNRIMRLYRPFVIRGYLDDTYSHATDAATRSAMSLLDLMWLSKHIDFPGKHWWVVRVHIFTAGILCCIALYHVRSFKDQEKPSLNTLSDEHRLKNFLCVALQLLIDGKESSEAARHAVEVLQTLVRQASGLSCSDQDLIERLKDGASTTHFSGWQAPRRSSRQQSISPTSQAEDFTTGSPYIPSIDWGSLFGATAGMRDMLTDQALLEAMDAFGPDVWQM